MRLHNTVRSAIADAAVDQIDVGAGTAVLQLRTGTAPASITDAATGTLLASFNLPNPAFGAATNGVATANTIGATTGLADGTVGYYRVVNRNGVVTWDSQSVGTSGTALILNTTTISTGVNVSVTSWTVTQPAGSV